MSRKGTRIDRINRGEDIILLLLADKPMFEHELFEEIRELERNYSFGAFNLDFPLFDSHTDYVLRLRMLSDINYFDEFDIEERIELTKPAKIMVDALIDNLTIEQEKYLSENGLFEDLVEE